MKEESLLLLSDLQKLINQVVLIDYTIIILGGDSMFPTITSNVYTHLKLEDAQREMERLERVEKEMKKCAK